MRRASGVLEIFCISSWCRLHGEVSLPKFIKTVCWWYFNFSICIFFTNKLVKSNISWISIIHKACVLGKQMRREIGEKCTIQGSKEHRQRSPHQLYPMCGKGTEAWPPEGRNFKSSGSLPGRREEVGSFTHQKQEGRGRKWGWRVTLDSNCQGPGNTNNNS